MKRVAITTGDPDGIGFEVTAKALIRLGPQRNFQFVIFRSQPKKGAPSKALEPLVRSLSRRFKRVEVKSWTEVLAIESSRYKILIDFVSPIPPAKWVELAAQACLSGSFAALVTGPLSKPAIKASGLQDMGHTEILKRLSGATSVNMGFLGDKFSVVLATGHIPLAKVAKQLDAAHLRAAFGAATQLKALTPRSHRQRPIAVLGLNPHAGDARLIGDEDADLIAAEVARARENGLAIEGPLVPDAAFARENWKKYSVFVACYHDQGLIPFKMIHGYDSGAQVSLGLPMIRTSVDHGTAPDIAGKNLAKSGSMQSAIKLALKMVKEK